MLTKPKLGKKYVCGTYQIIGMVIRPYPGKKQGVWEVNAWDPSEGEYVRMLATTADLQPLTEDDELMQFEEDCQMDDDAVQKIYSLEAVEMALATHDAEWFKELMKLQKDFKVQRKGQIN